ncbi:MAG: phosphatase PAP2 family protein [Phycisphaeraceae bacterium]|nr:phosphatase PAP2 family protein [Phycisphaeraceae bacterium]
MTRRLSPFLLVLLCSCAAAVAPAPPSVNYFDPATLPPTLLTPPPAVGSPAWNAEIDQMVALQTNPDPAELKIAREERTLSPEMLILPVVPQITRAHCPLTYSLLERVNVTTQAVTSLAKDYYHTRRPYLMSPQVKPLIDPHDNPSFPSGHTSGGYVWAYVMGMLVEDKRADFLSQAESFAQHRVLVGMHYPADVRGGREVALLVVGALLQNPQFQNDLAKARQELAAGHPDVQLAPR